MLGWLVAGAVLGVALLAFHPSRPIHMRQTSVDIVSADGVILSGAAVSTGVEELYSRLTGDGRGPAKLEDEAGIRRRVESFAGPSGFDPAPMLGSLEVPTLWLLDERDMSVPTFATVRVLDSLRAGGNTAHEVIVYPHTDHGLRDAKTWKPAPLWAEISRWLDRTGVLGRLPRRD